MKIINQCGVRRMKKFANGCVSEWGRQCIVEIVPFSFPSTSLLQVISECAIKMTIDCAGNFKKMRSIMLDVSDAMIEKNVKK